MKILFFWQYQNSYLHSLLKKGVKFSDLPYDRQLLAMLADNFGWTSAVAKRLEEMGHEVQILLVNIEPLQRAWARENGVEFNLSDWEYKIPLEQIKRFSPDIMWIGSMFKYFGDYLDQLKPYCKKIIAWVACPLPKSLNLNHIDGILTSHENYQSHFRSQGKSTDIILPCFEPNILSDISIGSQDIDCSFVGGLSWAHIERINIIKKLSEQTPIKIWSDYPKLISRGILEPKFWNAYFKLSTVRSRINPSVWGMDMYRILGRSKITINVHAEVAGGFAGNIRMFEATGMGALLITEDAPNIRELYEPGTEVITYKNTKNLVELINYYIDQPQERESIAQAGQARTLKDHSTVQRSKELIEIFSRYLK
jgi:spore maturation protein CgeB